MTREDLAEALDLDLEELAPPSQHDACLPDPDDADDVPPWHHPDPWTSEQAREAFWERLEELAHG